MPNSLKLVPANNSDLKVDCIAAQVSLEIIVPIQNKTMFTELFLMFTDRTDERPYEIGCIKSND